MKRINFSLDDSEDNNEEEIKINKGNSVFLKNEKKKKLGKNDIQIETPIIRQTIPFEEQENIGFILMDFKHPEELNKFKNIKSLSLIQQNISSIKVI